MRKVLPGMPRRVYSVTSYLEAMSLTFIRLPAPRPVGELVITASDTAITGVYFQTSRRGPPPTHQSGRLEAKEGPAAALLPLARAHLEEYFAHTRTTSDLPLAALAPPVEHRVWHALRATPDGPPTP